MVDEETSVKIATTETFAGSLSSNGSKAWVTLKGDDFKFLNRTVILNKRRKRIT